jgi:hypothetical protein
MGVTASVGRLTLAVVMAEILTSVLTTILFKKAVIVRGIV